MGIENIERLENLGVVLIQKEVLDQLIEYALVAADFWEDRSTEVIGLDEEAISILEFLRKNKLPVSKEHWLYKKYLKEIDR